MQNKFASLKPSFEPHRITKPIQLLAALLIGLFSINAAFLTTASIVRIPEWIPPLLCIAAVLNVPFFLISIFMLQTRYRPELQEDEYYSKYINAKIELNTKGRKKGVAEADILKENIEIVISNLRANRFIPTTFRIVEHLRREYEKQKIIATLNEMINDGYLQSSTERLGSDSIIEVL